MKQNLNEQIARIKQLLAINESSNVNKTKEVLNEQWYLKALQKLGPKFEANFLASMEGKLGKKIADASDSEIAAALKSAEMAVLRKEIGAAVYAIEKDMIDDVFSKYNMSVPGEATKAYAELQTKGINKGILKDVASEYRAAGRGVKPNTTVTPEPPAPPKPAPPKPEPPKKFDIPDVEIELKNIDLMDSKAVYARLKNKFPKAGTKDIQKMVDNLKAANIATQEEFNKAYAEAIKGFEPRYAEILNNPTFKEKVLTTYRGLSGWQQKVLWIAVLIPGGYNLLKLFGIPIDKATGMIVNTYKEIVSDQKSSLKDQTSSNNSNTSSGSYAFDDSGIQQYLTKAYPQTPVGDYEYFKKVTSPYNGYAVKLKIGGDGKEYMFKYDNGSYTPQ